MYSYMLQAAKERLRKRRAKTSKEETGHSLSALAMDIDDLPLTAPPLAPASPSCTIAPFPPSSAPSTIIPADIPKETLLPSPLQNPSPLAASITSSEDGVTNATTDAPSPFPVFPDGHSPIFPLEPLNASSPPVHSENLEIHSISSTPHSPSSFSFKLNVLPGDNIPSPIVSWSPPPSPGSVSQETSILPSSPSLQIEPPSTSPPMLPPLLENISPSPNTPSSSSLLHTNPPLFLLLLLPTFPKKN